MGCSSVNKPNVIIEVTYCGGCGWTLPARKVCDSIKQRLPHSVIDCKPEEVFTGALEIVFLIGDGPEKTKRQIFKGDKETVMGSVEDISAQVEEAFNKV